MKTIKPTLMLIAVCLFLSFRVQAQTDNAIYVSQSTPGEMDAGKAYGVSVTMKNTGGSVWKQGSFSLRLISSSENDPKIWGVDKVDVNSIVSPGEEVVFNFTVVAPESQGQYNMQWQLADGNAYFGEPTILAPVRVSGPSTASDVKTKGIRNNAVFSSVQVPSEMDGGQLYTFNITVVNNGSTTWKQGDCKIKVIGGWSDNKTNAWSMPDIELPYDISPGTSAVINVPVTAPNESGAYNFQCQVTKDGTPFGEPSAAAMININ